MTSEQSGGDYISATFSGDVSGQAAVGKGIHQQQTVPSAPAVTDAELAQLRQAFAQLKDQVAAGAPDEHRQAALERIGELEQATLADKPDLTTMEYVKRWFLTKLPSLAGLVTGVVINPVVGKLVQAAGDITAAEFRRRMEA